MSLSGKFRLYHFHLVTNHIPKYNILSKSLYLYNSWCHIIDRRHFFQNFLSHKQKCAEYWWWRFRTLLDLTFSVQAVPDFWTQFIPVNVYRNQNVWMSSSRLCYNRFSIPIALKVHRSPYLWATNKTLVATIMAHSCINSTKVNCLRTHHHMSQYPPKF
jgi:hypothetical protein